MSTSREIAIDVFDAHGSPVNGATVWIALALSPVRSARIIEWYRNAPPEQVLRSITTATGKALLTIPADRLIHHIGAYKHGLGLDYRCVWQPDDLRTDPFHLEQNFTHAVSLSLTAARPFTIHVRDRAGRPLPGVKVAPTWLEKHGRGESLQLPEGHLTNITNAAGDAVFDIFPTDLQQPLVFNATLAGWKMEEYVSVDPTAPIDECTATLVPCVPVTGRVIDAAGEPVPGATVDGSVAGFSFLSDEFHTTTDQHGAFSVSLPAGKLCLLFARWQNRASLPHTRLLSESPAEPITLQLGPAHRIYGTISRDQRHDPVANAPITITYSPLYLQPESIPDELPQHANLHPRIDWKITADDQGRFEFFTAAGHYTIESTHASQVVSIRRDVCLAEVRAMLHLDDSAVPSAPTRSLSGQVVDFDDALIPAPYAVLVAYPNVHSHRSTRATADEYGRFNIARPPDHATLVAWSSDRRFAAVHPVSPANENVTVQLRPASEVMGRLLDPAGTPLAHQRLVCRILRDKASPGFQPHFYGRTGPDGAFTFPGLVPGHAWILRRIPDMTDRDRRHHEFPSFRIDHPGPFPLGDLTLPSA